MALQEAAYLVDHMLKGREDIRIALIDSKTRFAIMAPDAFTTEIPEHSDLTPKVFWDRRARGLGATSRRPAVSCGEENLLCLRGDPYHEENILVHEFPRRSRHGTGSTLDPTLGRNSPIGATGTSSNFPPSHDETSSTRR